MGRRLRRAAQGPGPVGPATAHAGQAVGLPRGMGRAAERDVEGHGGGCGRVPGPPRRGPGRRRRVPGGLRPGRRRGLCFPVRPLRGPPPQLVRAGQRGTVHRPPRPTQTPADTAHPAPVPGQGGIRPGRSGPVASDLRQVRARLAGRGAFGGRLGRDSSSARADRHRPPCARRRREGPGRPPAAACGPAARRGHVP